LACQFVTGPFNIPVGEAKAFASVAKSRARVHFWSGELTRGTNVSQSHEVSNTFLLRIQNGVIFTSEGIPM
jgi:hypothetical protein